MAKTHKAETLTKVTASAKPKRAAAKAAVAAPRPAAAARTAVVVLAMHRTGSSALTRVLNLLGCDAPKTLIGADKNNESGYWESDVLRVFNDSLLASGGSDWRDWHAFNPDWYQTPRFAEYLDRARELLQAEYGSSKFFVFKDPRVTRIVPFWLRLLDQEGVRPFCLLTLRHPAEVAASLQARDNMTAAEAALVWLRNVLDAEHGSRGRPRAVVDYDQMMTAPSATLAALQERLGLAWPRLSAKVADEVDAFMTPRLRHHSVVAENGFDDQQVLRAWLEEAYTILRRWSRSGESKADYAVLDGLRTSMDGLAGPLREIVGTLKRQASGIQERDKEIAYLRGEAGKRGDAVAALTAEKQGLVASVETLRADHAALAAADAQKAADLEEKAKEIAYLRGEAGKRGDAVAALTASLEALRAEHTALMAANAQKAADLEKKIKEIDHLRGEAGARGDAIVALTAEKKALTASLQALKTHHTALEAGKSEKAAALEALRADHTALKAADARKAQDLEEKVKEIGYLRGEAGKRGDAIVALTAEKKALTASLQALKTDHAALEADRGEKAAALEALRAEHTALKAADARKAQDLEEKVKEIGYLRGEAGKRGDAIVALTAEKKALTASLQALKTDHAALEADRGEKAAALEALRAEHAVLMAEDTQKAEDLEEKVKEIEDLRGELGKQGDAVTALTATLATRDATIAALAADLETMEAQLGGATGQAATLMEEVAQKDQDLAALHQENAGLGQSVAEAEHRYEKELQLRQRLEQSLVQHVEELGAMARLLETADSHSRDIEARLDTAQKAAAEAQAAREAEIATLRNTLHTVRSALEQRSHEAEQTAAAHKEARRKAEGLAKDLEQARQQLSRQEKDLRSAATEQTNANSQITTLKSSLKAAEAQSAKLGKDIAERERALTKLRQKMNDLDAEINTQARDLASLAVMVTEKEEALKQRNAAAHEAQKAANDGEAQIALLREELAQLRTEIEQKGHQLGESEARCQALLDSTSWRVTAPLRRVVLALRR